MSNEARDIYDKLCAHVRETAMLGSIEQLLGWDERTKLPTAAGEYRAEQITYLAGMIHRRRTDSDLGVWLDELVSSKLAADAHSDTGATIRQLKRAYDRAVKLPQSLVEELARTTVIGQQTWVKARADDDFAAFQPVLEKVIELKRQEAEAIGYQECPYDALLDEYEPGELTSNLTRVLGGLRDDLVPLVEAIVGSGRQPDVSILHREFPAAVQERFGKEVAAKIGFDFSRGRLDETDHPFCTELGPHDCRITTRYDMRFFNSAFFGILHEAGHGIYEQGLRSEHYGLPPGQYVSLGIHESQSRMWENLVGRSRPFWDHFYADAQAAFPAALADVPLDDFFFAVNDVRPSLIRVEADEVTYNLHILIRFELEQALINDGLAVADLPAAWNEKYRDYLGLTPPSDADGVMQDIHWSAGLIGYFATYSLGNLYAAQLFNRAEEQLGDLGQQFARGEFEPLRKWLVENIHEPGQCYPASELAHRVTGQPLSHAPLIAQLKAKYGPLYGVA